MKFKAKIGSTLLHLAILCACMKSPDHRANVILISMDTLRMDHMGTYGYSRATTPKLDRFARRCIVFDRAYTQASHTLPAHTSIMTSLYPDTHGVLKMEDALTANVKTLAELLAQRGYETAAFVNTGWLDPKFDLNRGFEIYDFYHDQGQKQGQVRHQYGRNAEETNRTVFSWLAHPPKEPFFLFVHYFDIHSDWKRLPYDAPPPYGNMFTGDYKGNFSGGEGGIFASQYLQKMNKEGKHFEEDDRKYIESLYDGGIAYTDEQVGELLQRLEKNKLLEHSIVIIVSDHGEEFQEHGMVLHEQVYEELVHVPWIMKLPKDPWYSLHNLISKIRFQTSSGLQKKALPQRIGAPVQLIDLMPTVLDYLNIKWPEYVQGRSLKGLIEGKEPSDTAIYSRNISGSQYSITEGKWKLVYKYPEGEKQLFDLDTDPHETKDLSQAEIDRSALLEKHFLAWFKTVKQAGNAFRSHKKEIDKKTREDLKSLGYIQ